MEEKEGVQKCPCGSAGESRARIVEERELYKDKAERDVLEEGIAMINGCDMEKLGTLDISDKTIAIVADRWWPQTAKQEGNETSIQFNVLWNKRAERPSVGSVSIRSRNDVSSRKGCMVNGQMTKASNKCIPSPPSPILGPPWIFSLRMSPFSLCDGRCPVLSLIFL